MCVGIENAVTFIRNLGHKLPESLRLKVYSQNTSRIVKEIWEVIFEGSTHIFSFIRFMTASVMITVNRSAHLYRRFEFYTVN